MDACAHLIGLGQKESVDLQTAGNPDEMRAEYDRWDIERPTKSDVIGKDFNLVAEHLVSHV